MASPIVAGAAFAIAWTPCIGPVLGPILTLAGGRETVGEGALLLAFYSAGLAVPFLLTAVAFTRATAAFSWLRDRWTIDYDDAGAIGRRYRRQDEIGTPYAITVDFDSLDDHAVTVRDRDTMAQERVGIDALTGYLSERLPLW